LPCSRQEYIHASDLSAAFIAALSTVSNPPAVCNIGLGRAYSQQEVWSSCHELFGVQAPQVSCRQDSAFQAAMRVYAVCLVPGKQCHRHSFDQYLTSRCTMRLCWTLYACRNRRSCRVVRHARAL
jgi:nucleoside-diphosphate-sugar epimerase